MIGLTAVLKAIPRLVPVFGGRALLWITMAIATVAMSQCAVIKIKTDRVEALEQENKSLTQTVHNYDLRAKAFEVLKQQMQRSNNALRESLADQLYETDAQIGAVLQSEVVRHPKQALYWMRQAIDDIQFDSLR